MTVSQVGTPSAPVVASGSNTMSVTGSYGTGQNATQGNLLVALVTCFGSTSSTVPSAPSGWTLAQSASATTVSVGIYTVVRGSSAQATPTFTSTGAGTASHARITCYIVEFTGQAASSPVAVNGTGTGTTTSLTVTTSGNVPQAGCYGLSVFCEGGGTSGTGTFTAGTGWTDQADTFSTTTYAHSAFSTDSSPSSGAALAQAASWTATTAHAGGVVIAVQPPVPTSGPPLASAWSQPVSARASVLVAGMALASLIVPPPGPVQGSATLPGAGSIAAVNVIQAATASPAGAGSLTASGGTGIQGVASLAGQGTLTADVTQGAGASPAGTGGLTASGIAFVPVYGAIPGPVRAAQPVTRTGRVMATPAPLRLSVQGTAELAGLGGIAAVDVTQGAGAPVAGLGTLAAPDVTQGAGASAAALGSVTADVTQAAGAGIAGLGSITAPDVTQQAGASLAGTGSLAAAAGVTVAPPPRSAPVRPALGRPVLPGRAMTMSALAVVPVTQQGTATLSGAGTLAAPDVIQQAGVSLAGAGAIAAVDVTQIAGAPLAGQGTLTATTTGATSGPAIPPRAQPYRTIIPAGRRGGTVISRNGTFSPTPPPPFAPPLSQPAGIRIAVTRAGHVQSSAVQAQAAAPVTSGPPLTPLRHPVRARQPLPAPGYAAAMGPLPAPSGTVVSATATLAGAGTLNAVVVQGAGTALAGTGTIPAPDVTQGAGTSLAGQGTLTASSGGTIEGTASLAGLGTVEAPVTQGSGGTLGGGGTLEVPAVQQAPAGLAGQGSVTAPAVQEAGSALAGTGSLTAIPGGFAQGVASLAGQGSLTAAAAQQATAALAGAGTLTASSGTHPNGVADLAGTGSLTAPVIISATAALTGSGTVEAVAGGTGRNLGVTITQVSPVAAAITQVSPVEVAVTPATPLRVTITRSG